MPGGSRTGSAPLDFGADSSSDSIQSAHAIMVPVPLPSLGSRSTTLRYTFSHPPRWICARTAVYEELKLSRTPSMAADPNLILFVRWRDGGDGYARTGIS